MEGIANKVFCGSAANMSELPDNSVDLIFTSPPYETMRHYSDHPDDLGNYYGPEFVARLKPTMEECKRVLKDTGNLFLNFQPQMIYGKTSSALYHLPRMAEEEVGLILVQPLFWYKPNASPLNSLQTLKNSIEFIFHFARTRDFTVYKDAIREPSVWADKDKRTYKYNPAGKDPGNCFFIPKSQSQSTIHPAQSPDDLADRVILYGSRSGDVVLDPFCGSGTTLLMAHKHGRVPVGYDLHPEYAKAAQERLNAVLALPVAASSPLKVAGGWLGTREAAAYLCLSPYTLYTKTCRKQIPFHKAGSRTLYSREELDRWIRGEWQQNAAK